MSLPRPAPFGREVLLEVLPQRPPFVLLDEVLEADRDRAVATLRLDAGSPWFAGHFPGDPVLPGVLLIEAMAQACLVVYACNVDGDEVLYLTQSKARFRSVVRPPAELAVTATAVKLLRQVCLLNARVEVRGTGVLVAEADLGFATASYPGLLA